MAEEAKKRKINFMKIALFGLGPIVLLGVGLGAGAFLFMPTQSPVEQVEALIEKKLRQAGQLPSQDGLNEEDLEPQKVSKDTPVNETFVTSYYTFADNFTTNLNKSKQFLQNIRWHCAQKYLELWVLTQQMTLMVKLAEISLLTASRTRLI